MNLGKLIYCIKSLRFIPHLIVVITSSIRPLLDYERDCWLAVNNISLKGMRGYIALLMAFPEYRSLFYFRTNKKFLRHIAQGQINLYFHTSSDKIDQIKLAGGW